VPQANPKLLKSDQGFLEEFEAAPWLLPPRTPLLPYAGTHDFDGLLKLRSRPAGGQTQTITVLLFSKAYAALAQNSSEFGASQLDFASNCACWPPVTDRSHLLLLRKWEAKQQQAPACVPPPVMHVAL
jgi:hypothetical protein